MIAQSHQDCGKEQYLSKNHPKMPISQTTGLESSIWGDQHKLSPSVSLTLGSYPIILNCSGLNLQYYPKSERVQKNDTIFKIQKQDNQIDSSHTLSAFLGKKQNSRSLQALCTPYPLSWFHHLSTAWGGWDWSLSYVLFVLLLQGMLYYPKKSSTGKT